MNFQIDWLAKWAKYTPNKLFLREYHRKLEWSFSDFNNRTTELSYYLRMKYNIKKGDRIAVYSKNSSEYVLIFLACIKLGAVIVPLNYRLTSRELDVLLSDAEPNLFIYEEEFGDEVLNLESIRNLEYKIAVSEITPFLIDKNAKSISLEEVNISEEDPVMILYTAGTTGLSKGVLINHRMLFWNAVNTGLRLDLNSQDHTQSYAPFFHTGGWNVLFTPFLLHGASHTLLSKFDGDMILQLMEKEKTTILFGVPTMFQMMSDSPLFNKVDLSSVRYAIVGGAPMPIPVINTWQNKGIAIRQGYGLTEVGPNCFSLHQDDAIRKKGSIGFPNFYIDVKVMKDNDTECKENETGELWIKSPVVTPGYWKKEKETRESITDGYFHTGDLVSYDEDGFFYVVDRKKNMFISGGENVYPAEIEKYIYTNPEVKEVAVIGVTDAKWGEVGKVYIVLKENIHLTEEDIFNHCKAGLAKYKIPKHVKFLEEIPKTDAGKINKILLKQMHEDSLINS
ncbi:MAG: AMP-binding protein [Ignavibacteria bacterium]|nr:AMP-binding protein [Ignavibacteria bacterium]